MLAWVRAQSSATRQASVAVPLAAAKQDFLLAPQSLSRRSPRADQLLAAGRPTVSRTRLLLVPWSFATTSQSALSSIKTSVAGACAIAAPTPVIPSAARDLLLSLRPKSNSAPDSAFRKGRRRPSVPPSIKASALSRHTGGFVLRPGNLRSGFVGSLPGIFGFACASPTKARC